MDETFGLSERFSIRTRASQSGKYEWVVGELQGDDSADLGTKYKIEVRGIIDSGVPGTFSSVGDESDGYFSIVSAATATPSITVVLPDGGEEWFSGGNVYNIAWSSTNVPAVDIELADWSRAGAGGPLTWMIAKNVVPLDSSGNGKYSWKIPSPAGLTPSLEPGSQYEIRIYDTTNYSIFDTSKSFFKIDFNVLG